MILLNILQCLVSFKQFLLFYLYQVPKPSSFKRFGVVCIFFWYYRFLHICPLQQKIATIKNKRHFENLFIWEHSHFPKKKVPSMKVSVDNILELVLKTNNSGSNIWKMKAAAFQNTLELHHDQGIWGRISCVKKFSFGHRVKGTKEHVFTESQYIWTGPVQKKSYWPRSGAGWAETVRSLENTLLKLKNNCGPLYPWSFT